MPIQTCPIFSLELLVNVIVIWSANVNFVMLNPSVYEQSHSLALYMSSTIKLWTQLLVIPSPNRISRVYTLILDDAPALTLQIDCAYPDKNFFGY